MEYSVKMLPLVEIHICMLLKFIINCITGADEVGHALYAAKNYISLNFQFLPIYDVQSYSHSLLFRYTNAEYCNQQ